MNEISLDEKCKSQDLISQIRNETDPSKMKDLTYLFNQNIVKRNILRVNEIQSLLDNTVQQLSERVESNIVDTSELTKILSVAEKSAEFSMNLINNESSTPQIQINQINVNTDTSTPLDKLNRESRIKVLDAIDSLLNGTSTLENITDAEVELEELNEK